MVKMRQTSTPVCYDCKYFQDVKSRTCDVFPKGIPDAIWLGTIRHDKLYPGDQGIHFEPKLPNEFLSVTKVAGLFAVNPKTIYRALWSDRLPAYKIGKTWRIAKKDLEHFKKK
jgi:excisionase family DNA binding protein